jgi:hypothetical protein
MQLAIDDIERRRPRAIRHQNQNNRCQNKLPHNKPLPLSERVQPHSLMEWAEVAGNYLSNAIKNPRTAIPGLEQRTPPDDHPIESRRSPSRTDRRGTIPTAPSSRRQAHAIAGAGSTGTDMVATTERTHAVFVVIGAVTFPLNLARL